jgi:hypothetical protein
LPSVAPSDGVAVTASTGGGTSAASAVGFAVGFALVLVLPDGDVGPVDPPPPPHPPASSAIVVAGATNAVTTKRTSCAWAAMLTLLAPIRRWTFDFRSPNRLDWPR